MTDTEDGFIHLSIAVNLVLSNESLSKEQMHSIVKSINERIQRLGYTGMDDPVYDLHLYKYKITTTVFTEEHRLLRETEK